MEQTSDKDQEKKKVYEVKTFPVQFALGEIKENFILKTNAPSKPSNELLINKARKLHQQGNIPEATKYYQQIINQGCNDHRIFSNYAVILKNLGNLKEAEISTRKAIELNPDIADLHSNLGIILKDLGNFKEAD